MAVIKPRSVERDNQNSRRKFPFSDAAACGNGAGVIPPGAIIDAQLYVLGRAPGRVWLSSVSESGVLVFSDAEGEFAETVTQPVPQSAVPVVYTAAGDRRPGGVVVFGEADAVAGLVALGGQSFSSDETELAPAAVTFLGLPGVRGFLLDDGHVVSGDVKFRGANGMDIASWTDADGVGHLRFGAIGRDVEATAGGFITRVVAESDNTHFTVKVDDLSEHVIAVTAAGVSTVQDDYLNADQDDACAAVRRIRGTVPSGSATVPPSCGDGICDPVTESHVITLMVEESVVGTIRLLDGASLGTVAVPASPDPGMRFDGYFASVSGETGEHDVMYYRYDGHGIGRFTAGADVTVHAHFIAASSRAEVSFDGYGTLHIAAPSTADYTNPLHVSGDERPIPVVSQVPDSALVEGGADALADLILRPTVPGGEVRIGFRGLTKAITT